MFYLSNYYLDWTILLVIPGIIIAAWAQSKVNRTYQTYIKIPVRSGITGRETAARILFANGLQNIQIAPSGGMLSDHYNPRKKTVNLSEANFSGSSIAAVAVAAHESGHAMQHRTGYFPLQLRSVIAPIVSAASYMLWPILILGIMLGYRDTINIAVYIFLAIFAFQLITLPVEFNASRRALAALKSQNILTEEEQFGAKQMLSAAALTYVAATLIALLYFLRFSMLSRRR